MSNTNVTTNQKNKMLKMHSDAKARLEADGVETAVYLDGHGYVCEEINPAEDFGCYTRSPIFRICHYNASYPLGSGDPIEDPIAALESAMEERTWFYTEREKEYGAAAWPCSC